MSETVTSSTKPFFHELCVATQAALSTVGISRTVAEVGAAFESPNKKGFGDSAFPCFPFARELKLAPPVIAQKLAEAFTAPPAVTKVEAISGFFNVWYDAAAVAEDVLPRILSEGAAYGNADVGTGKTVCMDYSHPNIAKPFGVGHLRSTVIGHALKNILEKLGYRTVGINHLGDWGTQFGRLIVAYREWGDETKLQAEPILHLYDLYVRFHERVEAEPELAERGRAEFKKLEDGDADNLALWKRFRDLSLEEFNRVYERLGVTFDSYDGEAFFNEHLTPLIGRIENDGHAEVGDDGALVIPIDSGDDPPLLLRKADGATLYATRDLAAAEYRQKTYDFDQCLYIVGSAQALHFRQLFAALKKMGHDWADRMHHVEFGWVQFGKLKMATRAGNIIFLDDVLTEAVSRARAIVAEKNPDLPDIEKIAEAIGVGAVVFWQLSVKRQKDVNFDWDQALSFEGRTGPYLQYTHARLSSLMAKADMGQLPDAPDFAQLETDEERRLLLQMSQWPHQIGAAAFYYEPQIITAALLDMAQTFNTFYQKVRILDGEPAAKAPRLALATAFRTVLAEGLRLIGMHAPEAM